MRKTETQSLVLLTLVISVFLAAVTLAGCGTKKPVVESVASDACIACHSSAEIIDSLYTPPEASAGGGG